MKLVVQIPCLNEAESLARVINDIPRRIAGIDEVLVLVIDDGSSDGSAQVAREAGADYVLSHSHNKGLAEAFRSGVDEALRLGADVIVNFDGDGQYRGKDIAELITPLLAGQADLVIGDRQVHQMPSYTPLKRLIHAVGRRVVNRLGRVSVNDPVSGFRAFSRKAAQELIVYSAYSYTTETLIQAGNRGLRVAQVPVKTNPTPRPSRLFRSVRHFVVRTSLTMLRTYATYQPLKAFSLIGLMLILIGAAPIIRWFLFYLAGSGGGHLQSLILGSTFMIMGCVAFLVAILADLQARNRQLMEQLRRQLHALQEKG